MIVAIDCDLRRLHYRSDRGHQGYNLPLSKARQEIRDTVCSAPIADAKVLFEIASPVEYSQGDHKKTYHVMRWALWNTYCAASIAPAAMPWPLFVAPSSAWSKGYTEAQRQRIARCTARNHDLRECEAMLYFYKRDPSVWVPLSEYMDSIAAVKPRRKGKK